MNCADKFRQRMQASGEVTRVEPEEVDGRQRCIWQGCRRPLRGDGECVMGHPQDYEFRAAEMQAFPLELEALTCALADLRQACPEIESDPRVQAAEHYLSTLRLLRATPGEGPVEVNAALEAARLYLLAHPGQRLVVENAGEGVQAGLYDTATGSRVGSAHRSSVFDVASSPEGAVWATLREQLGVAENAAVPAALTRRVMGQVLAVFAADRTRPWTEDARVQAVRAYVGNMAQPPQPETESARWQRQRQTFSEAHLFLAAAPAGMCAAGGPGVAARVAAETLAAEWAVALSDGYTLDGLVLDVGRTVRLLENWQRQVADRWAGVGPLQQYDEVGVAAAAVSVEHLLGVGGAASWRTRPDSLPERAAQVAAQHLAQGWVESCWYTPLAQLATEDVAQMADTLRQWRNSVLRAAQFSPVEAVPLVAPEFPDPLQEAVGRVLVEGRATQRPTSEVSSTLMRLLREAGYQPEDAWPLVQQLLDWR